MAVARPAHSRAARTLLAVLVCAALTGPGILARPARGQAAPGPGALVLHFDFDGDLSTGVIADTSPSRLNGTLVNPDSASQVPGADGSQALALPGGAATSTTAPYVTVPNGLFRGLRSTTIATWLRWSGGPSFQWHQ